jgi:hypothetical protein
MCQMIFTSETLSFNDAKIDFCRYVSCTVDLVRYVQCASVSRSNALSCSVARSVDAILSYSKDLPNIFQTILMRLSLIRVTSRSRHELCHHDSHCSLTTSERKSAEKKKPSWELH